MSPLFAGVVGQAAFAGERRQRFFVTKRETLKWGGQPAVVLRTVAVCRECSDPAGDFLEFAVRIVQPDSDGAWRKDAGEDEIDVMIAVDVVRSKLQAGFIGNLLDQ